MAFSEEQHLLIEIIHALKFTATTAACVSGWLVVAMDFAVEKSHISPSSSDVTEEEMENFLMQ